MDAVDLTERLNRIATNGREQYIKTVLTLAGGGEVSDDELTKCLTLAGKTPQAMAGVVHMLQRRKAAVESLANADSITVEVPALQEEERQLKQEIEELQASFNRRLTALSQQAAEVGAVVQQLNWERNYTIEQARQELHETRSLQVLERMQGLGERPAVVWGHYMADDPNAEETIKRLEREIVDLERSGHANSDKCQKMRGDVAGLRQVIVYRRTFYAELEAIIPDQQLWDEQMAALQAELADWRTVDF